MSLTYSFPYLELVCCSMSSSNCCFLTCIQVSQEAGKLVWYSHLLKNFSQFVVIHTVKGFSVVSEAEVDVFLISIQFSRSVVSDSLRPHESQHARPPCPSPTPGVHSELRPSIRRGEITCRIKPNTCQRCSEASNKTCAHQDPETPQRLCHICL